MHDNISTIMVSAADSKEYFMDFVKSNLILMIAQLNINKNNQTSQTTFTSCMHDQMLESNKDEVKLEAMRCVTVMTAKGKLTVPRTLFPHIVKNVSSKNPELKKLIYLYLTNFADQEPDLALLPVASLQKSLKSPNPLLRSSALKVLTSMRLNILSAILMATLRNSVNDLSPYVRKTVAHSIIKIYRLDPSLRSDLIEYIERLFNDKNSMVLSSAVAAYEVVCPDRLDLILKHYRRFCFILADCNEWGQTLMLKILVRFILKTCARTKNGITGSADHDPKILLRSAKPLVHSNNSAVVMAVIKLFIAIANHNEVRSTITRPLIRLLYSHREIQLVVLKMIQDLTTLNYEADEDDSEQVDPDDVDEANRSEIRTVQLKTDDFGTAPEPSTNSPNEESVEAPRSEETTPITRDGYFALNDDNVIGSQNGTATEKLNVINELDGVNDLIDEQNIKFNVDENGSENEDENEESDGEEETESDDADNDDETETESGDEDGDEDEDEDEESSEEETSNVADDKSAIKHDDDSESEKEASDETKKDFGTSYIDLSGKKDPNAYREIFRPYIKSFYVKHSDCTQIRLAKLRILTNLSSSVNVSQILRELQAYISTYVDDAEFVSAAIHAIGRCAIIVKEVASTCLNGLTTLLSNNNEHIVSEAIVVLRSQIINKMTSQKSKYGSPRASSKDPTAPDDATKSDQESNHDENEDNDKMVSAVIKQVTKLLPRVTAPQARATILWILAEFCDKNLTAAKSTPNVLRLIAKSFCQEDNFVKLQSLTLASRFILSLDKEKKPDLYNKIRLLASYLFSLAKYDINHDVRDRGRFLKKLLEDEKLCAKVLNGTVLSEEQPAEKAA